MRSIALRGLARSFGRCVNSRTRIVLAPAPIVSTERISSNYSKIGAIFRFFATSISFVSPNKSLDTPIMVDIVTEEQAAMLKEIWPPSIGEDFKGKEGQSVLYYSTHELADTADGADNYFKAPKRYLWVGVGKQEKVSLKSLRSAVAAATDRIRSMKIREGTFSVDTTQFQENGISKEQIVSTIASTALMTNYDFDRYVTKPEDERPSLPLTSVKVTVKSPNGSISVNEVSNLSKVLDEATIYAKATNYARDLANLRSDVCHPKFMEDEAKKLVEEFPGQFDIEVLQFDELKSKGLNMLAAVGQGALVLPRLVILRYKGQQGALEDDVQDGKSEKETIALVGKGVTFDSGGLNIKPTNFIEEMYMDMGGSAAVLATMSALPKLQYPKPVVGAIALAENAVSDRSYHPSTILKSLKGLTVEVGNTDAEGRLILADALTYVQQNYKTTTVVDLATLTGACVVALGEHAAGLFTNNDALRDRLQKAADASNERVWPLPLYEEFSKEMKGTQSDLKNSGKSRYGGACTAAAFLKEFIEDGVKWAHIDIAGPAMASEKRGAVPKGGTGFGVQLLLKYLESVSKE